MPRPDPRVAIEDRIEDALGDAERGGLAVAREAATGVEDRWFGRVVVATHRSVADAPSPESALPAAVAVELLRGYGRVRAETLIQMRDERAHAFTRDPTRALLAGDYLYTSAYRALASMDHPALGDCVHAMTDVLESVTEGLAGACDAAAAGASFFEATGGNLGAGAGTLGATLGGADGSDREALATLGRALGTARGVQQVVAGAEAPVPVAADESALRDRAAAARDEARDALRSLSDSIDTDALGPVLGPVRPDAEG